MPRKIHISKNTLDFHDAFDIMIEKTVTKFGTGAKVDCPKEFIGRKVYLIIRSER